MSGGAWQTSIARLESALVPPAGVIANSPLAKRRRSSVRLEVGTAHRHDVDETMQLDIMRKYLPPMFRPRRTGGRCPPLNEREFI